MKKLFIYLREYKKECVFAPLFKMLEASFELFVPLVVAAIIDTGIAHADKGYVIRMCLLLFLLALIGLTCAVTAQYFSAKQRSALQQSSDMPCFPICRVFPFQR